MNGRRTRQRGNAVIETAMIVPILIVLLVGTAEIGRVTYVYFTVHKELYNLARLVATTQGANLCDSADQAVIAAKNFALSGSSDSNQPIVAGLTADIVQIRLERLETGADILSECDCSLTGCDTAQGGQPPQYVVVSIPDGFPVQVSIPYLLTQTVTFRPSVRVPFGGI